ncbi:MAG: polysaccharide biosynthesis/export family protein [Rhodospirillaceae bacterium]
MSEVTLAAIATFRPSHKYQPCVRRAVPKVFALICFLLVGTGLATISTEARAFDTPIYILGSGDKLRVSVFGEPDLSVDVEVDGSGAVSLPLIGQVKAGGSAVRQLESEVIKLLRDGYLINPRVSVEVLNYRPFFILGEVRTPGSYPYVNGMTTLNAVALAGGYTYRARTENISVIHASDRNRVEHPTSEDGAVLPGDIVRVPERYF